MEESVICNIHKIKLKPRYECHLCRENEEYNTRIPPATAGKSVDEDKLYKIISDITLKRTVDGSMWKVFPIKEIATAIKEAIDNGTLK